MSLPTQRRRLWRRGEAVPLLKRKELCHELPQLGGHFLLFSFYIYYITILIKNQNLKSCKIYIKNFTKEKI
jgi:hypothetical protein